MEQRADPAKIARILWRRRWLVIVSLLGGLAAGFAASIVFPQTEDATYVYEAVTTLQVDDQSAGPAQLPSLSILGVDISGFSTTQTHVQLLQSSTVLNRAAARLLGLDPEALSAQVFELGSLLSQATNASIVDETDLIEITVGGDTEEEARRRTDAIVAAYQQFLVDRQLRSVRDSLRSVDARLEALTAASTVSGSTIAVLGSIARELESARESTESAIERIDAINVDPTEPATAFSGISTQLSTVIIILESVAAVLDSIDDQITNSQGASLSFSGNISILESAAVRLFDITVALGPLADAIGQNEATAILESELLEVDAVTSLLRGTASQVASIPGNPFAFDPDSEVPLVGPALLAQLEASLIGLANSNARVTSAVNDAIAAETVSVAHAELIIDQARNAAVVLNANSVRLNTIQNLTVDGQSFSEMVDIGVSIRSASRRMTEAAEKVSAVLTEGVSSRIDGMAVALGETQQDVRTEISGAALLNEMDDGTRVAITALARQIRLSAFQLSALSAEVGPTGEREGITSAGQQILAIASTITTALDGLSGEQAQPSENLRVIVAAAAQIIEGISQSLTGVSDSLPGSSDVLSGTTLVEIASDSVAIVSDEILALQGLEQLVRSSGSAAGSREIRAAFDGAGVQLGSALTTLQFTSESLDGIASGESLSPESQVSVAAARAAAAIVEITTSAQLIAVVEPDADSGTAALIFDEARARISAANNFLQQAGTNMESASESAQISDVQASLANQSLIRARARLVTTLGILPQPDETDTVSRGALLSLRSSLELAQLQPQDVTVTVVDQDLDFNPTAIDGDGATFDLMILVGMIAGLFVGSAGAVIIELMDRRVRNASDLAGNPLLAPIGLVPRGAAKGNPHPPEVTDDPNSVFAEAVHLAATAIEQKTRPSDTILLTSPRPRDGKTMASINLARALGLRGRNVLLIDANLRKPDTSVIFELEFDPGLADAIETGTDVFEYIRPVEGINVLPAGSSKYPAVQLLARPVFSEILSSVSAKYDTVIIDGPPLTGFAETPLLVHAARATVLVVRSGSTTRAEAEECADAIAIADGRLLGSLINRVKSRQLGHLSHAGYSGSSGSRLRFIPGARTVARLFSGRVFRNRG